MRGKRGLSGIIETIVLILLVLLAVGIVWMVVQNLILDKTNAISSSLNQVSIKPEKISLDADNNIKVQVIRYYGEGDFNGVQIMFINKSGDTGCVYEKDLTLQEQGKTTITTDCKGDYKEVSIIPFMKDEKGKSSYGVKNTEDFYIAKESNTQTGDNTNDETPPTGDDGTGTPSSNLQYNKDSLIELGAIAWWKFDDNLNDEINGNNGVAYGNPTYASGKIGRGIDLDGIDDSIAISKDNDLSPDNITISAWVNLKSYNEDNSTYIISRGVNDDYNLFLPSWSPLKINFKGAGSDTMVQGESNISLSQWTNIIVTARDNSKKIYINGNLDKEDNTPYIHSVDPLVVVIGASYPGSYINATIDDVIIFNKALNSTEVSGLYNLYT